MVWSSLGRGLLATICVGVLVTFGDKYVPLPLVLVVCVGVLVWAAWASARRTKGASAGALYGLLTAVPACVGVVALVVLITFAFRTFTLFTNMVIGTGLAIPIIAICVVTGWWVGSRNLKRALLNSETQ